MTFKVSEKQRGAILGDDEIQAVAEVIRDTQSLSWGPNIPAFEKEFAEYCGVKHAVAITNATVGLFLIGQILRLREGDEVIMTPQTFKATALPMVIRKCVVRFADINETLGIAPATIEDKISSRTKAIFVTDMNGNPVDIDPVMDIARRHGVPVVIDAAHSVGAEYKGRKVGSLGDITCFSFQSLKNMTTGGEGGMITTNNDMWADEARGLRTMAMIGPELERTQPGIGPYSPPDFPFNDHSDGAYLGTLTAVDETGLNFRMNDIQAAIGRVQLRKLDQFNARRIEIAARYDCAIADIPGLKVYKPTPNSKCVYHLYSTFLDRQVIQASQHEVVKYLQDKCGVEIILRFWPVHLSKYMETVGHRFGECPVCERIFFEEQINLPICASMPDDDVDYVIESLRKMSKHFAG